MSIQGILQKGRSDCSALEKIADGILAFPRAMWEGRDITIINPDGNDGGPKIEDSRGKSFGAKIDEVLERGESGILLAVIFSGVIFAIGSFIASPFLGVGLACKKIALLNDPKAKAYHEAIEVTLKEKKLEHEKERLEGKTAKIDEEIKNIEKKMKILNTTSHDSKERFAMVGRVFYNQVDLQNDTARL